MSVVKRAPGIKGYHQWRKALWQDSGLREAFTTNGNRNRVDLRSVAEVIGLYGQNGRGSFVSAKAVADTIGCSERTVKTARQTLIDAGWFKIVSRNGGDLRRGLVVDISLPQTVAVGDYGRCAECQGLVPTHLWKIGHRRCVQHYRPLKAAG